MTFRTPEEAFERANNIPYGLSAGVWTDKGSKIFKLVHNLRAGVIWANTYNKFDPTSPFGGARADKTKGFWFNVNAELIIYGATEPDAKVTLGGHEIKLRSDGTFSFRFSLPDGKYDLPAVAISADGTDGRAAELRFVRETQYLGDVGATPQDPSLKPPLPDNL